MSIKPTEKLWNANYNKVMLINFTLFFSFYLITPLLPLYMSETFHSTKDIIGLVLSGYSVVALLMRPFSGFMVDNFPRKTMLLACLTANFVFFGGYVAGASLLAFAVMRTLHGGPFGAATVANSTMAIDVLPASDLPWHKQSKPRRAPLNAPAARCHSTDSFCGADGFWHSTFCSSDFAGAS